MSRAIAFFDFDGTITRKDTLLEFIRYTKGSFRLWAGFALNSPWLFAYRAGLISNQKAKERILTFFFKGLSLERFDHSCVEFARTGLPGLIRPRALQEMERYKKEGITVVLVSASPENWIRPWTTVNDVALLATQLEVKDGRLTGKIAGANCHGEEKVRRIKKAYSKDELTKIYAYGDTKGDLPMLRLADIRFYKPFR
jgi:HAD superfamily hydrolase (TIGR01490 family)